MTDQDSCIVCAGRQARRKEGMPPGMFGSLKLKFEIEIPDEYLLITAMNTITKMVNVVSAEIEKKVK